MATLVWVRSTLSVSFNGTRKKNLVSGSSDMSCAVPVDVTNMNILYVFVDVKLDLQHFMDVLKCNLDKSWKLALVSTIQFVASLRVRLRACMCFVR